MSKNKDKKPKEVKEEIKTPSAEVSENGAEVETGAGQEEVKPSEPTFNLVDEMTYLKGKIEELKDVDANHHNKFVIDLTVDGAIIVLGDLITKLEFIDKALSEKKK